MTTSSSGSDSGGTSGGATEGFQVDVVISGVDDFTDVHVAFVAEDSRYVYDASGQRFTYAWRGQLAHPVGAASATLTLTPPDAALLTGTTCAAGGLEIDGVPFAGCQDDPEDRYAILVPLAFRDLNGNGVLDQVSAGDASYLDEFIGWPEIVGSEDPGLGFDRVFYVERFENDTVRKSRFGAGFAYYPDSAFEPGFHLIEKNPAAPANCQDDCLHADNETCNVTETACLDAGGTPDACFVTFMECMYQPSAECLASCVDLADAPDGEIGIPARDRTAEPYADSRMCTEYILSSTTCGEGAIVPEPPEACLDGGTVLDGNGTQPGDPAVPCMTEYPCGDYQPMPVDMIPADWPCEVTVGLLGDACDPNAEVGQQNSCHASLFCVDGTCAEAPEAPAEWTCDPAYYGDHSCDCGCGVLDIDCADATAEVCEYCDDAGSCNTQDCPGTIDPTNNAVCT